MQDNNDKGKHFSEQYLQIYRALEVLETRCQDGKHLDRKMLLLIKLAVAAGLCLENTVKAHTAKALARGIATGRAGWPLLAVGKFGKGRTLALMTDEIWRWNFMAVGKKENPQTHLKLLRQAMRWLAQEPSFEQVQITSVSGTRNPGEKLEVRIQVLKEDYAPDLQLRVSSPEGEIIPLQVTPEAKEGEYSGGFTPAREGSYRLEAEAKLSGKVIGKDQKNFLVSSPFGEMEDSRPRFDLLKKIAKVSQGRFIPFPQWSEKTPGRLLEEIERLAPHPKSSSVNKSRCGATPGYSASPCFY